MAEVVPTAPSSARLVGHGLALVIGIASLVGGIAALISPMPTVMGATLLGIGLVLPILAIRSLGYSRAAWAFSISLLAVMATVTFFGAPKIRHVLGISLPLALIIPVLQVTAVIALSMLKPDYRDRA